MKIVIFKEVTTEGVITSIEESSKKYHEGLYADMNNLPERTMVKKGAAEIGDIIKELKTSRIKLTKESTAKINKEHDDIVKRLEVANEPFTDLLNTYNAERKVILDAEKARKQAIEDQVKLEADHEFALLLNKTFEYDQAELVRIRQEELKDIENAAAIRAIDRIQKLEEAKVRDEKSAENARLADIEHVRFINRLLLKEMHGHGLPEKESIEFIKTIARKQIKQLTINY